MDTPKIEHFKKFLALSVDGPSMIPHWIQRNILEHKTNSATIKAFFEAEIELLKLYLKETKEIETILLLKEFAKNNDPRINRIQLGILTKILHEETQYQPNTKIILAKAFHIFKDFAAQDSNVKIHTLWEKAKEILGDAIEINDTCNQGHINRESFAESLKILPPKSYLFRYKCIFDIWEEIFTRAEDLSFLDNTNKTTLPEMTDLNNTSVHEVLSSLSSLQHYLQEIKDQLKNKVQAAQLKEKLSIQDTNTLILNHDVEGCLLSLTPFLNDLKPLEENIEQEHLPIPQPTEADAILMGDMDLS